MKAIIRFLVFSAFFANTAFADDRLQAWIPEVISLPEDAVVVMDRAIGSGIRMFSFTTGADPVALLDTWANALSQSGYVIRSQDPELGQTLLQFSGRDILNAKIAVEPDTSPDRAVISFDATLE